MDVPGIIALKATAPPPHILDFDGEAWARARLHRLDWEWNGAPAPNELETTARLLWTASELIIGFSCAYTELDLDEEYSVDDERYGLWDRDVCEAFIRSPIEPAATSYLEFEVAPTGQWCDLRVDRARMTHDWVWRSGMKTEAMIDSERREWRVVMSLPWSCFGTRPEAGDEWAANLYRVSRLNGERRYLAFNATLTEQPNYHVPARFVPLRYEE